MQKKIYIRKKNTMNIDSYFFILICYAAIFISSIIISKLIKFQTLSNRFETIDGFRGLLASGVFIHHSIVWYNYLHHGKWEIPQNNLAIHLGESSVAFFFMITSFLFVNKLLNSKEQNNSFWKNILLSRIFRLTPLYFSVITLVILLILLIDNFIIKSSYYLFIIKCIKWYTFTIFGNPVINDFYDISLMTSGVTWSLPYEWLFYFSLPLISLFITRKFNVIAIIISLIFIFIYTRYNSIIFTHIYSFIGGIIPALILRYNSKINLDKNWISIVVISLIVFAFSFNSSNENYISKTLLIIVFTLIVLKNSVFGILKTSFLKYLGEVSYSTYLLHGLMIYIVFCLIGFDNIKNYSNNTYIILFIILSVCVVIISSIGYYFIEKPFINIYNRKFKK